MRTFPSILLLGALAASPVVAQEPPFEAKGEVRFHASAGLGSGASFDETRIVGPAVNLTRREDGSWAGDIAGQDVSLYGGDTKLSGPNVNLSFKQKNGKTDVEGLFYGYRVRLSVDAKKIKGRYGSCSFDLTRGGPPMYRGDVGCLRENQRLPIAGKAAIELIGEAASEKPPAPQLGLALVAILPR
ncbi:hypothetical protein [Anaeromyxobacter terrae]|uniref:hypothetical protein n=1 Tax=Anaeromyxobacter terrae TaxID=2925406 RepID=UPI001F57DFAA|nr:hypothetical protein [Anaeromyxobacter sp. SG22]